MEHRSQTLVRGAVVLLVGFALAACGGGGDGGSGTGTLTPSAASVPVGGSEALTLSPAGSATWLVDGISGGNLVKGTISTNGVYTAPAVIPNPPTVTISASAAGNTTTVTIVSRLSSTEAVSVNGAGQCIAPSTPSGVGVLDFDGDSMSDIVATANADSSNVSVLRQNAGLFNLAPVCYQFGGGSALPEALVIADFAGDSNPDLVVADGSPLTRAIRVRLGVGIGMFDISNEAVTLFPLPASLPSLATGHFDANSHLDLVVANLTEDTVSILEPNPDGTFLSEKVFNNVLDGISFPIGIAVADFNGDLLDDLAVANNGTSEVLVFLQTSLGSFAGLPQVYSVPGTLSSIAVLDLNGDHFPDLAVTLVNGANAGSLQLLISSGGGFFSSGQSIVTGVQPAAIATADLNGDGFKDLVVVNSDPSQPQGSVSQYLSKGDGTVVASETTLVGKYPLSIAVGDFNGDGFADLAVANSFDDTVTILRNRGG